VQSQGEGTLTIQIEKHGKKLADWGNPRKEKWVTDCGNGKERKEKAEEKQVDGPRLKDHWGRISEHDR